MMSFRSGELKVNAGETFLVEGASSPYLYTALNGLGLKSKLLEDGRRQIINFVMPGDLVGLQSALLNEMKHSVSATTDMVLCVFSRERLWELFQSSPRRAYSVVWLAAREERTLGENLVLVGQKNARERIAAALELIFRRALDLKLVKRGAAPMPWRQSDLADALGLSLVHTNKTLGRLRTEGLADWSNGVLKVSDLERLAAVACTEYENGEPRPLI